MNKFTMQALNAACSYMSAKVEKVNTRINQSQDIIYELGNVKVKVYVLPCPNCGR